MSKFSEWVTLRESEDTQQVMAAANAYWLRPTTLGLNNILSMLQNMDDREVNAVVRKLIPSIHWHEEESKEDSINELKYFLLDRAKFLNQVGGT